MATTLTQLTVLNFRCHTTERTFEFSPSLTLVKGDNAKGKTTLLEALYLLSRGRGFREEEEVELLSFDTTQGFVRGTYTRDNALFETTVGFKRAGELLEKTYYLEKSPVGLIRYRRAQTPVVLFAPHHLDIIVHGPSYRREYIDSILSLTDPTYGKALKEYGIALRKRNALLETEMSRAQLLTDITFWNEYLVERSSLIVSARAAYAKKLNALGSFAGKIFSVVYHRNEMTLERLAEKFETEILARRTLIGPQKDDIEICIHEGQEGRNVHRYASRSQQRLAMLWLKIHELAYLHEIMHEKPILLLDDVFSELDTHNKHVITELLPTYQTVITTTEDINVPSTLKATAKEIRL